MHKVLITDTDIGLSLKVPLTHRPTGRATGHTLNHRQLITISLATAAATANRSNYTHLCLSSYATLHNVFYWRTWTWAMFSSFFWVLSTFITLSMAKGRAKKITYPCPVCDKSCGGGTIHCTGCDMWVHPACVPLTDAEFEEVWSDRTVCLFLVLIMAAMHSFIFCSCDYFLSSFSWPILSGRRLDVYNISVATSPIAILP